MNDPEHTPPQEMHHVPSEEETQKYAKSLFWKRIGIGLGVILLISSNVTSVFGIVLIRDTQQTGSPALTKMQEVLDGLQGQADEIQRGTDASVETNDRILDCLDGDPPVGDCYRENRKNGAAQVLSITNVTIIAAACEPLVTKDMPIETRYTILRHCVAQFVEEPK